MPMPMPVPALLLVILFLLLFVPKKASTHSSLSHTHCYGISPCRDHGVFTRSRYACLPIRPSIPSPLLDILLSVAAPIAGHYPASTILIPCSAPPILAISFPLNFSIGAGKNISTLFYSTRRCWFRHPLPRPLSSIFSSVTSDR